MAKYMVMVQGTQADYEAMRGKTTEGSPAWNEQDLQAMYAHMGAINEHLSETGELVDAQGLAEAGADPHGHARRGRQGSDHRRAVQRDQRADGGLLGGGVREP